MTRRLRMGVMIVVPTLTKGEQRYPETVSGRYHRRKTVVFPTYGWRSSPTRWSAGQ
jgi:hypothetical protein